MGSIAINSASLERLEKPIFSAEANTKQFAQSLDKKDHLRLFRSQFIIPSKANIRSKKLAKPGE